MKQRGSIKAAAIVVLIFALCLIWLEWTGPHVHYSLQRDCLIVQQEKNHSFHCYGNPIIYANQEGLALEAAQKSWNAYVSEARKKNELRERVNLDTVEISLEP